MSTGWHYRALVGSVAILWACGLGGSAEAGSEFTVKHVACGSEAGGTEQSRVCGLGDYLTIGVDDLEGLQAAATDAKKTIVLFLNCSPLKDVVGEKCPFDDNALRFRLLRTDDKDNKALWSRILGRPGSRPSQVSVAVGLDDASIVATGDDACKVAFPLIWHSVKKALALVGIAVVLFALLILAGKGSAMLRDAFPPPGKEFAPFSLARTQMAWWFFNIATAFLLIWAATGAIDTLTPQLLMLMGISAGTALASAAVDSNKRGEAQAALEKARLAQQGADSQLRLAPAEPHLEEKAKQANDDLTAAQKRLDGPQPGTFLSDLLTDANGYSLHRLQVMVWTIVLTIVFWASVWSDLAMPEFSETLLGLMGISSGTYIGFKLPEKQTP